MCNNMSDFGSKMVKHEHENCQLMQYSQNLEQNINVLIQDMTVQTH